MRKFFNAAVVALAAAGGAAFSPPNWTETAKPFAFTSTGEQLDFSYTWPVEASLVYELAMKLQDDFHKVRHQADEYAREDHEGSVWGNRTFHPHYLHKAWEMLGQTDQLLSLVATTESFTGGAHGNSGFAALLWDRQLKREIPLITVLQEPGRLEQATRKPYCRALDAERLKRREGDVLEGQFSECPKPSELIVAPSDEDGDHRFDHLRFLAGPYVAGPYVEGEYEISLQITPKLLAAVKAEYRGSFEAQRQ